MRNNLHLIVLLSIIAIPKAIAITDGYLDNNNHPYVGLMVAQDKPGTPLWRCSGTLISPKIFVTAGTAPNLLLLILRYGSIPIFNQVFQRMVTPVLSANSTSRCKYWVRRPLHSGPLSELITNVRMFDKAPFRCSHQASRPSIMKSLVL